MEHHHDLNHSQGEQPRITSKHLLKKLAVAALKNVNGSEKLIKEHFPEGNLQDPHRLHPPKPKNLPYHLGW